MVKQSRFASNINAQVNPNTAKRNAWKNINNAVGKTEKFATSTYSKDKVLKTKATKNKAATYETVYNFPYKLTADNFKFNIPKNAYIKKVTFRISMKTSKVTGATFPEIGCYFRDKKATNVKEAKKGKTGWHDGIYWIASNKKLSKNVHYEEYEMSESVFHKGKYTVDDINKDYFGIDISFSDSQDDQTVALKWVWCEIEYDIPSYTLTANSPWNGTTENNRRTLSAGTQYDLNYTLKQSTKCNAGNVTLRLQLPWGVEFVESPTCDGYMLPINREGNYVDWTVNCNGVTSKILKCKIIDYTVDEQEISLKSNVISKSVYFKTNRGRVSGFDETHIAFSSPYNPPMAPHVRDTGCFKITSYAKSDDTSTIYYIQNTEPFVLINYSLDEDLSDNTVSFNSIIIEDEDIVQDSEGHYFVPANTEFGLKFNVPANTEVNVAFDVCTRPFSEVTQYLRVRSGDSDKTVSYKYTVLAPLEYHWGTKQNNIEDIPNGIFEVHNLFRAEEISFRNHRIATELETGAYVLPCRVKDGDAVMIQENSNMHMYKWEKVDYIGSVILKQLHFDPKSKYKDSLLDSKYKNKHYMGKQLASDEDIDLNIRLPPRDVVTLQGFVDVDKPIPINANHRCFEGDPLNHRGWAEIYGVTVEEKTNPHWYKCNVDVKYLTHNLNTRFHIKKGDKSFKYTIPEVLAELNSTGDSIGNQSTDLFDVNTDGVYSYIEDEITIEPFLDDEGEEIIWNGDNTVATIDEIEYQGYDIIYYLDVQNYELQTPVIGESLKIVEDYSSASRNKNVFSIDEGQHILITSKDYLSSIAQISLDWMSSKLSEYKENAISRIIRLIDENSNVVFEYEYTDFNFETEKIYENQVLKGEYITQLSCQVIGRVKVKADYIEVINKEINVRVDVEGGYDSEDDDESTEYYGSNLHFKLNSNVLQVVDEGYNGREVSSDNIELEGKQYKWQCEWVNNNTDADSSDIQAYLDIVVQDNILNSKYAGKYDKLYVSPFPITGKHILFTRNAEEGVIYYLDDDEEEFSYLMEPFYQYHNGVDLRNSEGSSILNLNYGYNIVYLENGLVSLGINRLDGQLYLRKWDNASKEYVTLFILHLNKFDDIQINNISDDRIELQASDSTITMYRGHPYVVFKHELEDIGIDSIFNTVWGQKVDGTESYYPVMFDLMNHDNLLPQCVTSKLDDDCVIVSEEETSLENLDIGLTVPLTAIQDTDVEFTVTNVPEDGLVYYLVDGDEIGHSVYPEVFSYKFTSPKEYTVTAVYVGDDTHSYSVSESCNIVITSAPIDPTPPVDPTPPPILTGKYKLVMNAPSKFSYRDGQKVVFTLTQGGNPVAGKLIQMTQFQIINSATTNSKGQVSFTNNHVNSHPAKYKIGARFFQNGQQVVRSEFKDVTVGKASSEFVEPSTKTIKKGSNVTVKLRDKNHTSYNINNQKVTIYIDNDKKEKKTNSKGNVSVKLNKKGTFKIKCVFAGNKNYNKVSKTFRVKVK